MIIHKEEALLRVKEIDKAFSQKYSPELKAIGSHLYTLRKAAGMDIDQVAAAVAISPDCLARIEEGREENLGLIVLTMLAACYHTSARSILETIDSDKFS